MLEARRCTECGKLAVEAGHSCPFCGHQGGDRVTLSGLGQLVSWTVIRVAPVRYASEAPYAVGVIDLEEGARLTARIEGDAEQLLPGQPVALASVDSARGPIFRAA
jgi:uncharacterized OB-fold protein